MWTSEQAKAYGKLYREIRRWTCLVCDEEMGINNKYKHLRKDYHLIGVDNMIARGLEVPSFIRKAPKNWICPICNDDYKYVNKSRHASSKTHRDNIDVMISKGLPIPNIFVNEKMGLIVDI